MILSSILLLVHIVCFYCHGSGTEASALVTKILMVNAALEAELQVCTAACITPPPLPTVTIHPRFIDERLAAAGNGLGNTRTARCGRCCFSFLFCSSVSALLPSIRQLRLRPAQVVAAKNDVIAHLLKVPVQAFGSVPRHFFLKP
jgi:hypothetical protein